MWRLLYARLVLDNGYDALETYDEAVTSQLAPPRSVAMLVPLRRALRRPLFHVRPHAIGIQPSPQYRRRPWQSLIKQRARDVLHSVSCPLAIPLYADLQHALIQDTEAMGITWYMDMTIGYKGWSVAARPRRRSYFT